MAVERASLRQLRAPSTSKTRFNRPFVLLYKSLPPQASLLQDPHHPTPDSDPARAHPPKPSQDPEHPPARPQVPCPEALDDGSAPAGNPRRAPADQARCGVIGFASTVSTKQVHMVPSAAHPLVSGVYSLLEWRVADRVYTPPDVEGRFILCAGTVTTVLRNHSQAPLPATSVCLGTYRLHEERFAYRYADVSSYLEGPAAVTVSHAPLWDGERAFSVHTQDDAVVLRALPDGGQEFRFTATGLTYAENGIPLRRWQRLGTQAL